MIFASNNKDDKKVTVAEYRALRKRNTKFLPVLY